ncbi:hypothetical protein [Flavobacterium sp. U410]|jgi:hypothetical protein
MRRLFFISLIISNFCFSQSIDFADKRLEKELLENFDGVLKSRMSSSNMDSNKNGKIEISEALDVQEIQLYFKDDCFETLEDLKYFENLVALKIELVPYSETENILHLNLSDYSKLLYLEINSSCIKSISVSKCAKLKSILIRNYDGVNAVELNGIADCENLEELEIVGVSMNNLDLSFNKNLKKVSLSQFNEKVPCNVIFPNENKIETIGLENLTLINPITLQNFAELKELIVSHINFSDVSFESLNKMQTFICVDSELKTIHFKENNNFKYIHICNNPLNEIEVNEQDLPNLVEFLVTTDIYDKLKEKYSEFSFFKKIKPVESMNCGIW